MTSDDGFHRDAMGEKKAAGRPGGSAQATKLGELSSQDGT